MPKRIRIHNLSNYNYLAKGVELTNIDDEEDRDIQGIDLYMKKYSKLFKFLFSKYANSCAVNRKISFDALKNKHEQMSLTEFRKMLNEHQISTSMINRDELTMLFRLINLKHKKPTLTTVTYEEFLEAIIQTAILVFSKPKKGVSQLPFVETVKELMKTFKEADVVNGENILLYTDPNAAALLAADKELIKELNKRIEKSPDEPLPEGYKKVVEKEMDFIYDIQSPIILKKHDKLNVCCEILDDILFKEFNIHFIEPFAKITEKTRVKQQKSLYEGKQKSLAIIQQTKKEDKKFSPKRKKLTPKIKLLIAELPEEIKEIGDEVGSVLEDIIKAVETGQTSILLCGAAKEKNKNIMKKKLWEEENKKLEEEREKKRNARHKEIKQKVEEKKKFEAENEEKKKLEEEEKKKQKIEKEKRLKELKKKEIADRMQKYEEERQKKEEENLKNKPANEQSAAEEREKKVKEREEFLKKKQEEMF